MKQNTYATAFAALLYLSGCATATKRDTHTRAVPRQYFAPGMFDATPEDLEEMSKQIDGFIRDVEQWNDDLKIPEIDEGTIDSLFDYLVQPKQHRTQQNGQHLKLHNDERSREPNRQQYEQHKRRYDQLQDMLRQKQGVPINHKLYQRRRV